MTDVKEGIILFFVQILSFMFISINYRAIAQANYLYTILTDIVIASLSFFVIRKIAKAKNATLQWIGFALGSVVGSCLGIFLSKFMLGS